MNEPLETKPLKEELRGLACPMDKSAPCGEDCRCPLADRAGKAGLWKAFESMDPEQMDACARCLLRRIAE